jgi:REP element-mobilizing transposase RayT
MPFSQRHLPHLWVIGRPLFVTFRLYDSLPPGREFPKDAMTSGKAFLHMDKLLDEYRESPKYLQRTDVAQVVVDAIRRGAETDYRLHTWTIMPNHVHLLFTPHADVPKLMRNLKGSTARYANRLLGRTGTPFWQDESYDRLVRDPDEFRKSQNYILQNPVRAGLARSAEEYLWSSAGEKSGLKPTAG